MIEAKKGFCKKIRRFSDWLSICNKVRQYINEGNDFFTVDIGGFSVKFDETEREDNGCGTGKIGEV